MPIFSTIIGLIGSITKALFGLKTEQQKVISEAIKTIQDVNASEKERAVAFAQYMAADSSSGYWLAVCIRPLIALLLVLLVTAWFFGYAPPNIEKEMPPFIAKAVDALMVFIGFYVPARSLEKIVDLVLKSKAIAQYLNKF